ncbi:hypothetical protein C479_14163 [Halovivax asiaticus JCM 14624]|uniref:Uncharacterized protein n=1 Tax=Halovivax asiaticus JCM 14624 TaxID=1227490 RepID=M0BCF2_9EURY|nr:hypothetical protein [Halovivax asiaticus]ELZ08490.1 hypothetical protein C479_14163 [Halovivax asiaticus JCM 14624]
MKFDCCAFCEYRHSPQNTYRRDGWDYPHGDEEDVAEPVTERMAVLPDGICLRLTPPCQPTVDEILEPGALITTSYSPDRIQKVFHVRERPVYGVPTYSIAIGDPDTPAGRDGYPKRYRGRNIKELVYQDGAIRKLFWNNDDEIKVVGYDGIEADYQATISAGWSA